MMVAKRALFTPTPVQNAKRIKSLQQSVYRRSLGEVKERTAVATAAVVQPPATNLFVDPVTDISTGANQGQRVGNQIRLKSIEVRGYSPESTVDILLIQSRTGKSPVYANFTQGANCILSAGTIQQEFRILSRVNSIRSAQQNGPVVGSGPFTLKYRFGIPMKVNYTGPGATEFSTNQVYLVIIQYTGEPRTFNYAYNLKYTDA